MSENPDYEEIVCKLPKKMFSGRFSESKGLFFCYELPVKKSDGTWSDGDGRTVWYTINSETAEIIDNTYQIWQTIKCEQNEERAVAISAEDFAEYKKKVENHINRTYMRSVQAPVGIKPKLVTWMQLT